MEPQNPIIVAIDVSDVDEAKRLVDLLRPYVGGFKIGLEFQMSQFSRLLSDSTRKSDAAKQLRLLRSFLGNIGSMVMWDTKFHDIPDTVGGAVREIQVLSPWAFTMMGSNGHEAIRKAVAMRKNSLVLGVTVLTSIKGDECKSIYGTRPKPKVLQFARLMATHGGQGIVCSGEELLFLRQHRELDNLIRVVPGIRPLWAAANDQSRVMTPAQAMENGATRLVIGRPITAIAGAEIDSAKRILDEIHNYR